MGLSLKALATANPNLKMFTGMDYKTAISQMNSKMITALRRCYLAGKSGLLVTQPSGSFPVINKAPTSEATIAQYYALRLVFLQNRRPWLLGSIYRGKNYPSVK